MRDVEQSESERQKGGRGAGLGEWGGELVSHGDRVQRGEMNKFWGGMVGMLHSNMNVLGTHCTLKNV